MFGIFSVNQIFLKTLKALLLVGNSTQINDTIYRTVFYLRSLKESAASFSR